MLVLGLTCLACVYMALRLASRRRRTRLVHASAPLIQSAARELVYEDPPRFSVPDFSRRLAVIEALLPTETFETLRTAALRAPTAVERSYFPGHKRGGTVAYDRLRQDAPAIVAFYNSSYLRTLVSRVVGEPVYVTPENDQSSCSVLIYDRARDHIGWHYDHNFYRGRHFTVLLFAENCRLGEPGLSSAVLEIKDGRRVRAVPTPANTLVVFEGARVLHRVSRLGESQCRVVISMTFGTQPVSPWPKDLVRRVKDTAYFGVRALWA